MNKTILLLLFFVISLNSFAMEEEHGIYLQVVKNIKGDYSYISDQIKSKIESAGFKLLAEREISTPDRVRKDGKNLCGYRGKLLVFTSDDYKKMLTSFGNKYLVGSFLRIGIHETNQGVQVIIADPETINRIIFNDLNDELYKKAVSQTLPHKAKIVTTIHSLNLGANVKEAGTPKRSTEDLREAAKDMFMMVGPMTFFEDEDQFPRVYSQKNDKGIEGLEQLKKKLYKNLENFQPNQEDREYRWTKDPKHDLQWKIVGETYSPDKKAILFGLTRNRTESVSFYIVGSETDENKCPGLDHLTAYPIEVLLMMEGDKIVIHTPRQMFRMDMYFWDAGMGAFMNHMSMPGILDESIYKALFAKEKE